MTSRAELRGRPAATSHAAIEQAAFRLFAERGFAATTLEAIAAELGVSRRTVTRYYRSKLDIPWGRFDQTLAAFRDLLDATPAELPLWERVHRGVVAFNDFPADADPSHRDRMRLILHTPALQAHSVLRYDEWRAVIAAYVAEQTGARPTDLLPRVVAQVSQALAVSAYEAWLETPETAGPGTLPALLDEAMSGLRDHLEGT